MRSIKQRPAGVRVACGLVACGLAVGLIAAATGGQAQAQAACEGRDVLGVARTITLDTTGGKLYGGLQYGNSDLLRDKEVLLTFDDGPLRRHTRKVLEALEAHCTKATFFMVGRMAVSDPAMVREVEAAGHTIASHTWSHPNLVRRSARSSGGEIELGISAVQQAAVNPITPFFRFPYLADPNSMLAYAKTRDFGVFSIDIDSYDYKTRSAEKVYSTIMRQLRNRGKGIMLFHDIQPSTANAMRRLLDTMHREGYKIVHIVSEVPVKSLPEFDEKAAELHAKRRTQVAAGEIDGGDFETAGPVRSRLSQTERPKTGPRVVLNERTETPPPVRAEPPAQPPLIQRVPKDDWRREIWGN